MDKYKYTNQKPMGNWLRISNSNICPNYHSLWDIHGQMCDTLTLLLRMGHGQL